MVGEIGIDFYERTTLICANERCTEGINRKKFYIGDVIVVIGSFFENGFLAAEVYKQ